MTVVAGNAFGLQSPVKVLTPTLYVSLDFTTDASLRLPAEHEERALFPVSGELYLDGEPLPLNTLVVLDAGSQPILTAGGAARVMLLGGKTLDGPRFVWWNFVSASHEKIEAAKLRWKSGGFEAVPGETEFIPLPD